MNSFFKSLAAVSVASGIGFVSLGWTKTSKAGDDTVDKSVCEDVKKACNKEITTCMDQNGRLAGNLRKLAEYCHVDVSDEGGKFVIKSKPVPTTTPSTKPTTPPPPPKPQITCVDTGKVVFVPPQCECADGRVRVLSADKSTNVLCVGGSGTNGKDGKDGKDGVDGKNGKDGRDGKDGVPGKDGVNGTSGTNGANGVSGKDGTSSSSGGDVWASPPLIGLEFTAGGWTAMTHQGIAMGESLGVGIHGRISERSRFIGTMDVQWTSIAPDTGGMYFLWPQFGYRYYYSGASDLRDASSLDFKLGVRQGLFSQGEKPTFWSHRFTGNSAFAGAHATFSAAWNVRLSSWLAFGASGWAGYGWLLSNPTPCPPPGQDILPAYKGFGGGIDGHLSLTFF